MIPTSARRRIVIKMLIDYSTGRVTPRRRIEKKTTSQSSAEAPSYTMGAVGLSTGPLPWASINGNNPEGETNKQTNKQGWHVVGRIMVLCVTHLYKSVLALRTSQSL